MAPLTICNLICILLNARSVIRNLGCFRELVKRNCYDIIFVVESWLDSSFADSMLVDSRL